MLCIIANVKAGHGRAAKVLAKAEKYLKEKNIPYQVFISEYAGHSVELAKELVQNPENILLALGGDGTAAEVAQGIVGTDTPMGIIPAGSGNDYRRCFRIPSAPEKALDIILKKHIISVDTIKLNGRTFINILNIGFDNEVAARAKKYKALGKFSYFIAIFDILRTYKATTMRIRADGEVYEEKLLLICAGCGTHYGGGMNPLPNSDPSDGLLDVCMVKAVSKLRFLYLLPKYITGRYEGIPAVRTLRARELTIECLGGSLTLGGDGEIMENAIPAHVVINPSALKLLV